MAYTGQEVMDALDKEIKSKPDLWVREIKAKVGANISGNQWLIDLSGTKFPEITSGSMAGADTTLILTEENLNKLLNGQLKTLLSVHNGTIQLTGKAGPATGIFQLLVRARGRL